MVVAGLILAFLIMLLFGGTELDRGLLILFGGSESVWLVAIARMLTAASAPLPLLLAAAAASLFLLARGKWRRALLVLIVAAGGRLLLEWVQVVTTGLRPVLDDLIVGAYGAGFPDGHAANATITALALAFLLTRHHPARSLALGLAAAFAITAGAARLLLAESWPSDVIGGWALGLAWTLMLFGLAGEDLRDGTARAVRHSPMEGDSHGQERPAEPPRRDRPAE